MDTLWEDGGETVKHMMSGGEIVADQMPSSSHWSPELRLASAVLASTLGEIRTHFGSARYRRRIAEDLKWIRSDDIEWPFSFVRLCHLLGLEPAWVRERVRRWCAGRADTRTPSRSTFRTAA